jgi:hypothetical protein
LVCLDLLLLKGLTNTKEHKRVLAKLILKNARGLVINGYDSYFSPYSGNRLARDYFLACHGSISVDTSTKWGQEHTLEDIVHHALVSQGDRFSHTRNTILKMLEKDEAWLAMQTEYTLAIELSIWAKFHYQSSLRDNNGMLIEQTHPINVLKEAVFDVIGQYQNHHKDNRSFSYMQATQLKTAMAETNVYSEVKKMVLAVLSIKHLKTKLSFGALFHAKDPDALCLGLKTAIALKIQELQLLDNGDADLLEAANSALQEDCASNTLSA